MLGDQWRRVFSVIRVTLLASCALLSLACAILFTILLVREWDPYSIGQRVMLILLAFNDTFTAITTYLMIVVSYRLVMEGARAFSLFIFQVAGALVFFLVGPSLPCKRNGVAQCKNIQSVGAFASWILSGILFIYMLWLALSPLIPKPHKLASIDDDSLRPLSVSSTDSRTGLLQSDRRSPRRSDTILSTSSFGSPGSLRSFQLSPTLSYPSASAYSPSSQRSWGQQPELSFPPSLVPRQQEIRQFSNSPRGHMITLPALPQQPYRSLPSSPYLYRNSPRVPPRHAFSPGLASPSSASYTGTNARYAASDVQSLSPVSRTTTPSYPRTPSPLSLNVTEPVVPRKSLLPLPNPFVTYRLNGLQEYQDVRRFGSVSSLESGERTYYLHRGLGFDSTSSRSTTPRTS